jgi:hypothetical protein
MSMEIDERFASAWSELDALALKLTDHSEEANLLPELFHYTTAEGLIGIVNSRCLWASNMLCLNDASEAEYPNKLILDAVGTSSHFVPPDHKRTFKDSLITAFVMFEPFVTCFCENGDLLSQWRGYGGSGAGFALGFSRSWLSTLARIDYDQFRLQKVIYCPEEQQRLIREYLEAAARVSKQKEFVDDGEERFWREAAKPMVHFVMAFKDPAFREEREWRLVNRPIVSGDRYRYRQSGHRIVPYVEIPIQNNEALTGLVRGPYFANDRGSEELLANHGFYAAGNVRDSKIPLRL